MSAPIRRPPGAADPGWPPAVVPILGQALSAEYASLTRSGRPVTWPVTPYLGDDARTIDISTGLTYPSKAERARHDPRVALLFSHPAGAGLDDPPVVLVQGLASVRDSDLQGNLDRYLRVSGEKFPQMYDALPSFVIRRMNWYLARIWVQITPLRMLWWPRGDLDAAPERWQAPAGTQASPSDPRPPGQGLPARATPPSDWHPFADRADHLGRPVLTVVGDDGWPLPVRCRDVERLVEGYRVRLPAGVLVESGAASLTFHTHNAAFDGQENVVLVGQAEPEGREGTVHVRVERALSDWSITGNGLTRSLGFLRAGRKLRPRVSREAARRSQPVPVVRLPQR